MSRTLGDMATDVAEMANRPSADFRTKIKASLQRRYQDIVRSHNWFDLLYIDSVTVAASTQEFGLPAQVEKVIAPYDLGNDIRLYAIAAANQARRNVSFMDQNGASYRYAHLGTYPVQSQPATTSTMRVESSEADLGQVRVVGTTAANIGSFIRTETIELSGTAGTQSAGSVAFARFLQVSTEVNTAGYLVLRDADGIVGYIPATERSVRYRWVRLDRPTQSSTTFTMVAKRKVPRLSDDADVPILAVEDIMVQGAFADTLRMLQQHSSAMQEEQLFIKLVDNMWLEALSEDSEAVVMPSPGVVGAMETERLG
jgi:hypothetical protein